MPELRSPLVGREEEIAAFTASLERLRAGQGGYVAIPVEELPLPDTLQGVIMARVDRGGVGLPLRTGRGLGESPDLSV